MSTPASKKSVKSQSPSKSRFFSELYHAREVFYVKIFVFSLITTFLLVSIMLRGYQLFEGVETLQAASNQRQELAGERAYWEDVVARHPGYRDAYFKLAVLSYQLGEKGKAKEYLETSLSIDPNFSQGREFSKQVGL